MSARRLTDSRARNQRETSHRTGPATLVWVRLRSRLPNRSGLKSLPCAARGTWTRRDRLAQTMSLITLEKISRRAAALRSDHVCECPSFDFRLQACAESGRNLVLVGGGLVQVFQAMLLGPL